MLSTALLTGLVLGLFMAISVGPTLFAVLKYSVNHSYKAGLAFVLGVSISDIIFVTVANLASVWLEWLHQYERTMKYGFSGLLIVLGLYGLFKKYKPQRPSARVLSISGSLYVKIFLSGFFMNTFNPALILQWIAVATAMAKEVPLYRIVFFSSCLGLVLSIDILKVFLADVIRRRLTLRRTMYLNRISALFILGFGVAILALAIFNIELKAPELKKKKKTAYYNYQSNEVAEHRKSFLSLPPLMSDAIRHECGLAYIRLLKPLAYYHRKYGTAFYGLNKLYLLMEKQHNRGQDGAGIAAVKLNIEPGYQFMHRLRISGAGAIGKIFQTIQQEVSELEKNYPDIRKHSGLLKGYVPYMGEILLGHLRYGTQGRNDVEFCHPFFKPNINPNRNLTMAGNFNLVNTDELFAMLDKHPTTTVRESDLGAMIETVHYYLCMADETNPQSLNIEGVLKQATAHFDGGYVFSGLVGNGDSFVMRDANGIRPAFFYKDDEIIVAASERPAIMTAFNVAQDDVQEIKPGHAIIVKSNGDFSQTEILPAKELKACSFERIYFSRGGDADIYRERMQLGRNLADKVLKAVDNKLKNTIVSFIPNTAETAFYGLIKGLEDFLNDIKIERIANRNLSEEDMRELISRRVRIDKIAIKDVKMRTFITEDASRNEMVQHVYDITYGTVERGVDTLVVIDDSIVRGTTLRESIIKMLDRLGPIRIIIVSSAPQIRFPDCYGIDMSRMGDFIAFQAAVNLLMDRGMENVLTDTLQHIKDAQANGTLKEQNYVKAIYAPFTPEEISKKIADMLRPEGVNAEVDVIYQSIEGLYNACPNNKGDWYFTGNYPTPGGNAVANRAFMNYMDKKEGRGY